MLNQPFHEPSSTNVSSTACPSCASRRSRVVFKKSFVGKRWALAHCGSCDLHYTDPIPSDEDIRSFYEGDYHSTLRRQGATELAFGSKFARYRDWILTFLRAGRTLDVGCATGLLPKMLQDVGFEAEGLELNAESAQWGARHYGVSIAVGTLKDRQLEVGEQYSLITLTDVLEHTQDPPGFLQQVSELLRPGGFAMVTFPDITAFEVRYSHFAALLLRREWLFRCHIPMHTWEFSNKTARALFEKAGFEVVGFRRAPSPAENLGFLLSLVYLPARLTTLWGLRRWFGTQMEFMLRKKRT